MTSQKKRINEVLSSTPRRAVALFAAVGTITGAIAGVIALLPKSAAPPDSLSASFSDVKAYPNMSLEQFDERVRPGIVGTSHAASTGVVSYELAADTSVSPSGSSAEGGEAAGSPGTSSGGGNEGETGSGSTGTDGTGSTTPTEPTEGEEGSTEGEAGTEEGTEHPGATIRVKSPEIPYPQERTLSPQDVAAQTPQALRRTEGALVSEGPGVADDQVEEMAEKTLASSAEDANEGTGATALAPSVMRHCAKRRTCGARQELETALTYDPNPAKAAKAVSALFNNSRAEVVEGKLYPIGVMVTYNVSLAGFAHESATLEWSLIGQRSKRRLPRPWWRNIVVAHIKPAVNSESLYGSFWVPVPPQHGNYLVHLVLSDGNGVPHSSSDATPVIH
jgi:hypothetical protein